MSRIVIELTNRCNLRCGHCYDERHAGTGDLGIEIIEKILREARACGIDHLCFTGGEPTLHRQFPEIVRRVGEAAYTFSFVTNGSTFPQTYPLLVSCRTGFQIVTFSLDGSHEATHDRLRGTGSFRRVMRAASLCVVKELPFSLSMVVTAQNHHEVSDMARLAARLGSAGLRFVHLMPTPETAVRGLDLSPGERRRVEADIWGLRRTAPIAIDMAPGYFHDAPFFPCAPLELEEFNVDYHGNLTLCCQLSGYAESEPDTDLVANLGDVSLMEACQRFRGRVARYLADKQERVTRGEFGMLDYFPCWYCVKYLGKTRPLQRLRNHPWAQASLGSGIEETGT